MNGNRFEFLEFGDERQESSNAEARDDSQSADAHGSGPQEMREADGTPLAQVRITDPRGYGALLREAQSEGALRVPGIRAERARTGCGWRRLSVSGVKGQASFSRRRGWELMRAGFCLSRMLTITGCSG